MRTSTRVATVFVFDGNFKAKLRWMFVLVLALPLLAVACSSGSVEDSAHSQEGESGDPVVTVLIYSGRPNPTFNLGPVAAEGLSALVGSAERLDSYHKDTVMPSILGYNGFLVENRSGQGVLPRRLVVYQGAIEIRNGETRFSSDSARGLEHFLLEQAMAADVLDERSLDMLKEAIGVRDEPEIHAEEPDTKQE